MSEINRQVADLKRWAELLDDAGFRNGANRARLAAFTIEELNAKQIVHGQLVCKYVGNGWNDWYEGKCSVCGKKYGRMDFVYNYCPNCGAKVELKEE